MAKLTDSGIQAEETEKGTFTNPFDVADDTTDVVFLVEREKLHFNKTVLGMFSPVFKAMFKEKSAETIPLPGETLKDMVLFLEQLHPAHLAKPITDETLPCIIKLADEYQVETVRQKCSQYVGAQMQVKLLQNSLSDDQLLAYLWICEQHCLRDHREKLLELASKKNVTDLQRREAFKRVPPTAALHLLNTRCQKLEEALEQILCEISGVCGGEHIAFSERCRQKACRECSIQNIIDQVGGVKETISFPWLI